MVTLLALGMRQDPKQVLVPIDADLVRSLLLHVEYLDDLIAKYIRYANQVAADKLLRYVRRDGRTNLSDVVFTDEEYGDLLRLTIHNPKEKG